MFKRIKAMAAALVICILAAVMCACTGRSGSGHQKTAVSVVVGMHGNSRELNLSSTSLYNCINDAVSSYSFVSVVRLDGAPELVSADSYAGLKKYSKAAAAKVEADLAAITANIMADLYEVEAQTAEVDTLKGIREAARSFSMADPDTEKVIYVIDTGLSTCGVLNFRNNLLCGEADEIAEALDERSSIPDLEGITVIWQQMGDVAGLQQELSDAQRAKLEDIWDAIITRGGGELVLDLTNSASSAITGLPEVSRVELANEVPIAFDRTEEVSLESPVFLYDDLVRFVPDSSAYVNELEAAEVLDPIADYMNRDGGVRILLVGTTAGDEQNEFSLALSRERAEAVKATLISLGVPADRIDAIGMGSADPWHIYGAGTSGDLAAGNRKVVVLNAASEQAAALAGGWN